MDFSNTFSNLNFVYSRKQIERERELIQMVLQYFHQIPNAKANFGCQNRQCFYFSSRRASPPAAVISKWISSANQVIVGAFMNGSCFCAFTAANLIFPFDDPKRTVLPFSSGDVTAEQSQSVKAALSKHVKFSQ